MLVRITRVGVCFIKRGDFILNIFNYVRKVVYLVINGHILGGNYINVSIPLSGVTDSETWCTFQILV